jgi:hypothetical protein
MVAGKNHNVVRSDSAEESMLEYAESWLDGFTHV